MTPTATLVSPPIDAERRGHSEGEKKKKKGEILASLFRHPYPGYGVHGGKSVYPATTWSGPETLEKEKEKKTTTSDGRDAERRLSWRLYQHFPNLTNPRKSTRVKKKKKGGKGKALWCPLDRRLYHYLNLAHPPAVGFWTRAGGVKGGGKGGEKRKKKKPGFAESSSSEPDHPSTLRPAHHRIR